MHEPPDAPCPFCAVDDASVLAEFTHFLALRDAFPVSPGHALLVPKRHCESVFDLDPAEWRSLPTALEGLRTLLEESHQPQGYNVGFNDRAEGGQTVFHAHLHVIPRYRGDVPEPRGGIRHVIPGKGHYEV